MRNATQQLTIGNGLILLKRVGKSMRIKVVNIHLCFLLQGIFVAILYCFLNGEVSGIFVHRRVLHKEDEYDQEMPQSHSTDQPMAY